MSALEECLALFDGDDGRALLLSGWCRTIAPSGRDAAERFFAEVEAAAAAGKWLALSVAYEAPVGVDRPTTVVPEGGLRAWVFSQAQWLEPEAVAAFLDERLGRLSPRQRRAGVAELSPGLDAVTYAGKVERIREWIADGDCYQVNLTFPLEFRLYGHPLALFARLREQQPVRYGAYIATPEACVLSRSPELFFSRQGLRVVTRPMKGTAPRGATPEADDVCRSGLLASEKERAENVMIVDLLRNDLGRLAQPGQVRVDALCAAEAYPTLWQMVSTVSADLPGVRLSELFGALFPCGSITGAPKRRAMERIASLETAPRGLYTGALGWLAPDGDCRFNVAIRTLEIGADGRGKMGVGSGIVIDARPDAEYAECLLKARFLTAGDPGFELIETLRLEEGGFPLLPLHLERLQASAQALGFACDGTEIEKALAAAGAQNRSGRFRVRLALSHLGRWRIETEPLIEEGLGTEVVLAGETVQAGDYLLRHKTSLRDVYDLALSALPAGVFDALFCNERGEVCEGARSNVFVLRDGVLLTPPVGCGLLPGVMRRHLLGTGQAIEQVLTPADLLAAEELYVGNALRGLMRVTLRAR